MDIPTYRGLEPGLGLNYNSSNTSRGSSADILGIGWQLNGLSRITRVSQGRGTPTFTNADDIYQLDGQALLACADGNATNKWTAAYPARFKSDKINSSCLAGGNFTTLRESDKKILFSASKNEWTVYSKDGTRYIYRTPKALSSANPASGSDLDKLVTKSTWLLAEIRDTQATANVVRFTYFFDSANGYAPRPGKITYGPYSVSFGYETRSVPLSQWATGTGILAKQRYRLVSVWSERGSAKISAYKLGYATSAETKSSLLSRVERYGNNFARSGNVITGGSKLPNPYIMTYTTDQLRFAKTTYSGKPMTGDVTVWDYDRNGTDEIFSRSIRTEPYDCDEGSDVHAQTVPLGLYRINTSKALSNLSVPQFLRDALAPATGSNRGTAIDGIARFDPRMGSNGQQAVLIRSYNEYSHGSDTSVAHAGKTYGVNPTTSSLSSFTVGDTRHSPDTSTFKPIIGNFDLDPASEFLAAGRIYDLDAGVAKRGASQPAVAGMVLDMDGDALTEYVSAGAKGSLNTGANWVIRDPRFANTPSFASRTIPNPGHGVMGSTFYLNPQHEGTRATPAAGDVNGDGKTDVVILSINRSGADGLYVALSTGQRFLVRQSWLSGSNLPNASFSVSSGVPDNTPKPSIAIHDVNGDGLGDLVYYEGTKHHDPSRGCGLGAFGNTTDARFLRGAVRVFLSDGTKFLPPSRNDAHRIEGYSAVGDFNGDGLADVLIEGSNGAINFGSGGVPNLLKTIKDPMGATTTVSYAPSSVAGTDNKVPGVQQLVSQVDRSNGRGATRTLKYRYTGSDYDYYLRRSLGFKTVTTTLPRIAGESADPQIVKTYLNTNFGLHGTLKSKTLIRSGKTWQRDIYDFATKTTSNGPYSVRKIEERNATLHAEGLDREKLLETKKTFAYSPYGELTRVTDYGRTVNGANVTTADDVTSGWQYKYNLGSYIVNKPRYLWRQSNSSDNYVRADLLQFTWHYYDQQAESAAPSRGNLTSVQEWIGNRNSWARRVVTDMTFDDHGNLRTQKDGLNATTTHTYGGPHDLYRLSTTNAVGDRSTYAYDYQCGSLTSETDPNGLVTTHQYDGFCRPIRSDYPDESILATYYYSLGNGAVQSTLQRRRSASYDSDKIYNDTQDFFDGYGEVYKRTRSGKTHSNADKIATVFTYDARGNKTSESNPLSWAAATDNAAGNSEKTRFEYDTLGRRTRVLLPNGMQVRTRQDTSRRTLSNRPAMDLQEVVTRDERCLDGDANTICGVTIDSFDTFGNKVLHHAYDEKGSDVDGGTGWRLTRYEYDLNSDLTMVVDPAGNTFTYKYDIFGNRIESDDPSLGRWTMKYNAVNSMTEQTDAKGQKIKFWYDPLQRQTRKDLLRSNGSLENRITYTYGEVRSGRYNKGHLTTASQSDHTVTYDYHHTGQVWVEKHTINGRTYQLSNRFRFGQLNEQRLPYSPGSTATRWEGLMAFDAGNRMTSFAGRINAVDYNLWDNPTKYTYANGVVDTRAYDTKRGWLNSSYVKKGSSNLSWTLYTRFPDGRIKNERTSEQAGAYNYSYDYSGRLTKADNPHSAQGAMDQTFSYDKAGRMRTNSHVGTYDYNTAKPRHAPYRIRGGGTTNLSYDANGNMTQGYEGRVMTYDAENRPLKVTKAGTETRYEYGADGKRLKKIEQEPGKAATTTVYFGPVEIRKYGQGSSEEIVTYPHPNVRLVNGTASYLHKDQLETVRAITNTAGERIKRATYKPFGEKRDYIDRAAEPVETKGFIGERFDGLAELQFLNARYYDPELGLFIQPDWFEVTDPGVGTNRYSYSFNDPINRFDPNGNRSPESIGPVERGLHWAFEKIGQGASAIFGSEENVQNSINTAASVIGADVPHNIMTAVEKGEGTGAIAGEAAGVALGKVRAARNFGRALFRRAPNRTQPDGIWDRGQFTPIQRGNLIEDHLAGTDYSGWTRVGSQKNGYSPAFDFNQGSTWVSLKTVDTAGKGWQSSMRSHINELSQWSSPTTPNSTRVLDIRVQPGGGASAQSLIDYGTTRGVVVRINEF
ncbi:MAG: RHS repeat-associated core domain-containing protein [Paracoccaceae bacterium]